MPEKKTQHNSLPADRPLDAKDIKHVLIDRNDSIAGLARKWKVPVWNLKMVIYRYPNTICQRERELLAKYLGCEVWQIGNEPTQKSEPTEAAA